jgi:hypothetical protein
MGFSMGFSDDCTKVVFPIALLTACLSMVAVFVCGVVMMSAAPEMLIRVAAPGFHNDASIRVALNGDITYRECIGAVGYSCSCCDCGDDSRQAAPLTWPFDGRRAPPAVVIAPGSKSGSKSSKSSNRSGVALEETQVTTVREHPKDICPCGVSGYEFGDCATKGLFLEECPELHDMLSKVSKAALCCGVVSVVLFAEWLLSWVLLPKYSQRNKHGIIALTCVVNTGALIVSIAFAIIALPILWKDLLSCGESCCKQPTAEGVDLGRNGFVQQHTLRDTTVAYVVFAILETVALIICTGYAIQNFLNERRQRQAENRKVDTPAAATTTRAAEPEYTLLTFGNSSSSKPAGGDFETASAHDGMVPAQASYNPLAQGGGGGNHLVDL